MIECKNLTKTYKNMIALDSINMTFNKGEFIVLKGASGSGKSTLLALIAGLTKPTNGEVVVENRQISKMPDNFVSLFRREKVGFIFQKYNLITTLNVFENIITPLIPSNPNHDELNKRVDELLSMFSLKNKKTQIVKNLSGGEQQRVAICRALINNPSIIIADEPTANLDSKLSLEFIEIIKKLKNKNRTIIVATHDPLFFELNFCDKIVNMKDGKCF
jgi:putative ABC transport system ATP-binding protein